MKRKIGKPLSILLAVVMTAELMLTLTGCGKSESAVTTSAPSPASNTSSSADDWNSTTEVTYTEPEKILGIIIDNETNDFSENNVIELCSALGLNLDDYDEWHFNTATASTTGEMAERLMHDYACTDLVFAAKGSADVAEEIRYDYPDVMVYVTEAAKDTTMKIVRTEEYAILNSTDKSLASQGFSNGVAWTRVKNKKTAENTVGLINKKGELLYLFDHSELTDRMGWSTGSKLEYIITTPFINGLSAIYGYSGGNAKESIPGFIIVNQNGEEVYTCLDGNTYMCGQTRDGNFIILKYDSGGFDTNAAYYFYILGSDLILKETGIKHDSNYREPTYQVYKYTTLSDGVYYSDRYMLNLNNSSRFRLNGASYLGRSSDKAFLYVYPNHLSGYGVRQGVWAIPKDCLLSAANEDELRKAVKNEGFVAPPNYSDDVSADDYYLSSFHGGSFYHTTSNGKPIDFVDMNGEVLLTLPSFPEGVGYRDVDNFSGGYAAIYLTGADGKSYVTIIDENGNIQYDPVLCTYTAACSCNGYLFAYNKGDNQFNIIAPNGELRKMGDDLAGLKDAVFNCHLKDFQISIGEGFMYLNTTGDSPKYISTDGKQTIKTVYANYNSDGELVYTDGDGNLQTGMTLYSTNTESEENNPPPAEEAPAKTYITPSSFTIEGKWKNVGDYTFGQVQAGAIVAFDGTNCNVYSPKDTYAFYKDGDNYKLECTSLLFSDTLTFTVKIVDEEHIDIYNGSNYLEMTRVN